MTVDTDYRDQVLQIRQAARARLLEVRQARLLHGPLPAGPDPGLPEERPLQRRLRRADRLTQLTRQAQDARLAAALEAGTIELWDNPAPKIEKPEFFARWREGAMAPPEIFGPPLAPPESEVELPDLLTLSADMRVDGAAMPEAEGPAVTDDPVEQAVVLPQTPLADAGLMALPGAGPGLIWMLQKCGITTLADLAATDAAALVPKLGLVGQIVDIPAWQSFARRQLPQQQAGAS